MNQHMHSADSAATEISHRHLQSAAAESVRAGEPLRSAFVETKGIERPGIAGEIEKGVPIADLPGAPDGHAIERRRPAELGRPNRCACRQHLVRNRIADDGQAAAMASRPTRSASMPASKVAGEHDRSDGHAEGRAGFRIGLVDKI
jgi:hypothetical protein